MNIAMAFKRVSASVLTGLVCILAAASVPAPVLADDTEVFFPPQQTTLQLTNPNIMFLIDTSGSMGGTDGLTQTRLQRVQTAFNQIITTIGSNVNVGLMRFDALQGGAVMFPVAPIDAYVDTVDTNGSGDRIATQTIVDSASEAYQAATGGTVTVAPQVITMSKTNSSMGIRFDNVQIPQGVTINSAILTLHAATGISTLSSLPTSTIVIEQTDNAAGYASTANNITGRTYTSSPSVTWPTSTTTTPVAGDDFAPPDLATLVNSVIGRSGWCGGNALAFKISTTTANTSANLSVYGSSNTSTDSTGAPLGPSLAPTLTLSFSPTDPNLATGCNRARFGSQVSSQNDDSTQTSDGANQPACKVLYLNTTPSSPVTGCGSANKATKVGMRFANLNIPQGSTILSAAIDFTSYTGVTDSNSPTLKIQAANASNPTSFSSTGSNTVGNLISSPGVVGASVNWATTAWSSSGTTYTTPDLSSLVQAVVNRTDWTAGSNAVEFFFTPVSGSGQHAAYSYDGGAAYAPKLRIQIQGASGRITVRQYLQQVVNSFAAQGGTPTMGAYYEAARYFRGEGAFYGLTRSFGSAYAAGGKVNYPESNGTAIQVDGTTDYASTSRISHRASFDYGQGTPTHNYPPGCSDLNLGAKACDGESWTGTAVYKSPITDGCQSNNIILLSDGLPNITTSKAPSTPNSSAKDLITALPGFGTCAIPVDSTGTTQTSWQCGNELASYLFTKDQSTAFGGIQGIRTYTIAFGPDFNSGSSDAAGQEFLRNMANNGGGQYFTANTVSDVVSAFSSIIGNILSINTTFVAPAVTVNTFNRLTNRNDLYFAVFRPDTDAVWSGNLKKYRLYQGSGDGSPQIYDSSNPPLPAVDAATGYFKDGTTSYWSASADGSDITKGGAASNLTNTRTVYTYVGSAAPSNVDLTATANVLTNSNSAVTATMLGLPATATATDRTNLIAWATGVDVLDENGNGVTTDARKTMGDPLHSEPALITYGGTDASPDIGIYMGTNIDGLHAFNASTGAEYWAFLPKELLSNLYTFYTDSGSYLTRPYGFDGPISSWVNDGGDGVISGSDTAYLYAGLRRGGRSYYALDVTNRSTPKLMFQIAGGSGDYNELGQTWSRAIHAKIRINATNKDVLIFTGGYDPAEDGRSGQALAADGQGRALFVADATTGALLWWAGYDDGTHHPNLAISTMNYSIPGSPKAVDMDGDGLVDRIYFADNGGQVFRIILGKDSTGVASLSNATGSRIAALAGTTVATARRFYNAPDVALITQNTSTPFVAVSLGSGFHEHPLLQENSDRFYILRDPDVTNNNPSSFFVNGDADLYDATNNLAGSSNATTASQARVDISNKKGLYITLGAGTMTGEKVMTESTTVNNQVIFATFQPNVSTTQCSATQGLSRLYQISVTDATPTQPLSGTSSTTLTTADRSKNLKQGGLPPNPTILFPSIGTTLNTDGTKSTCIGSNCLPDQAMICVGAECFQSGLNLVTQKTSWRRVER